MEGSDKIAHSGVFDGDVGRLDDLDWLVGDFGMVGGGEVNKNENNEAKAQNGEESEEEQAGLGIIGRLGSDDGVWIASGIIGVGGICGHGGSLDIWHGQVGAVRKIVWYEGLRIIHKYIITRIL